MTLLTNDDLGKRELATSELDAVSAGLVLTHGPNPPMGGAGGCHPHQPPHTPPPRYYPGGVPNSPGLRGFH
ncbi:MAG: hypothetical protein ACXVZX_10900 [Terriglobales bacterium]